MLTWQDYEAATDKLEFIRKAINQYRSSPEYLTAIDADLYERQKNTTINRFVKWFYTATGQRVPDTTSTNTHLASNFFHRLNTTRCTYSLGNGVSFPYTTEHRTDADGNEVSVDVTKEKLGKDFDTVLYQTAYDALEHRVSYLFWNVDRVYEFKATEFCPLHDEETGALRGGIRFWSMDWDRKPVQVRMYTEDGFIKYRTKEGSKGLDLEEIQALTPYKVQVASSQADGEVIVGGSNYSALPIVPLYGSRRKQSTLIGLKEQIDAYDLVNSGFCNELQDVAEVYWIINDAMTMQPKDIQRFREQLKFFHATVTDSETPVTPFTQPIPTDARMKFLESIREQMYRDFAVLDVSSISSTDKTATEINAAYQPMDEEADDFEYQIIEAVRQLLALQGIDDVPSFNRNRVANQTEQTQMIMLAAQYLDQETILQKLPFVSVDEISGIMARTNAADYGRFSLPEVSEDGGQD